MTIAYIVRHGQASAGTDDYDRLSALGQQQAIHLGEHWHRHNIQPDAVFAGSLKRQQHTAELALNASKIEHSIQQLPALNEYNHNQIDDLFGDGKKSDSPGGLTFEEYVSTMQRWRDSGKQTTNNYESWQQFEARGISAILNACVDSNHNAIAFFTSGGVVSTVLQQVLGFDFSHTMYTIWQTRNSSVTTLKLEGRQARLLDFNTVSHLEYHSDRSLITLI